MSDRCNPFEEIEELFDQLNSGFPELDRGLGAELGGQGIKVDVADNRDEIIVAADVPGFSSGDIDVTVQDRRLTIAAESSGATEEEDETAQYYRRERTRRSVSRTVTLPTDVEETEASASYENGVLTVELPKVTAGEGGVDIEVK